MADWNPLANDIFLKALEAGAPGEREKLLDEACAGRPELRAQVDSLLSAIGRAGSFLENPAVAVQGAGNSLADRLPNGDIPAAEPGVRTESMTFQEGPGTRVARYKLLQLIGEGGMGVVYMAEQEQPVRRRVALKIIKPGMDSRQVIARFEAERQALAMMDHHNIARVLDAGTTDAGRPYFVMELVHGVPITQYCDENHLTLRERVELFLPVCRAIQHAHQKGIIHRDVKPSNVLVTMYDGRPVPKVIDFGVAKAIEQRLTEKTMFTQFGTLVGTLEYMSPEQAELSALGVDTRSDVYSLGVLLYELLTGTTPLERKRLHEAALGEILRRIKEEEPPPPSTRLSTTETLATIAAQRKAEPAKLSGLVRGELDWVVMKCLEKDRTRRYETVNSLARDLERYLEDDPVEACPPSKSYRLRKFARKHRAVLSTVVAFAGLLLAGVVVSTWQAVRATIAEGDVTKQRNAANAAQRLAVKKAEEEAAARRALERSVHDLDVTLGMAAYTHGRPAEAGLWFAQAARARIDAHRRAANDVRIRTFDRAVAVPVAAMRRPGKDMWRLFFHPSLPYVLSSDTKHEWVLWHWQENRTVEFAGIGEPIRSATWTDDGKRLIVGTAEGRVHILSFPEMQSERMIEHRGEIRVLALSSDGKWLALGGSSARAWDLTDSKFVTPGLEVTGPGAQVRSLAFSRHGDRLAVGDSRYKAAIYRVPADADASKPVAGPFDHGAGDKPHDLMRPLAPLFFNDDSFVLGSDGQYGLLVRDAATGQPRGALMQGDPPTSLVLTPDGQNLLFAADSSVMGYNVPRSLGPGVMLANNSHSGYITSLALSRDGQKLITGSYDHTSAVWDWKQAIRFPPPLQHAASVHAAALSVDGRYAATAQEGGMLIVWDLQSAGLKERDVFVGGKATTVRLSTDGRLFLPSSVSARDEASLTGTRLYEVATGRPVGEKPLSPGGIILDAFLSTDARQVAMVTGTRPRQLDKGQLDYLDAQTGQPVWESRAMPSEPRAVRVRPDGKQLAVCCAAGEVLLIAADGGREVHRMQAWSGVRGASDWINNGKVDYSPDGSLVVASGGYTEGPRVWNSTTGELRCVLAQTDKLICRDVQFSSDGRLFASAGTDSTLRVWEVASGKLAAPSIVHPNWLNTARFSPDGQHVATACVDGSARVWDWRTGRLVCPPLAHDKEVIDVAFVPHTPWLMTLSFDHTARVWDTTTGETIAPWLATGDRRGISLAVTPDGRRAVVGTRGDTVRVLALDTLHDAPGVELTDRHLWYEILSCQQIVSNRGTTRLTPDEWFERWKKYRTQHAQLSGN